MALWKQLFAKKSLEMLAEEAKGENRLRRVLGPISLTSLGVGAIIGAGIFVMTGRVAAVDAGPAVILSYVVAGVGCALAALCYAEFASTAPVAGSAYTYAYATLGELLAWIIGWDLVLEYAMACAVVAAGWSKYLNEFLTVIGYGTLPPQIASDPFTTPGAWFNLPAVLIMVAVTVVLVIGIRESATTNAVLVITKVGIVLFVIFAGLAFVKVSNWTGIPPSDRLTPEDQLIPDVAKAAVENGLPPQEAQARIDQISKQVMSLWEQPNKLTPTAARERDQIIKRQIEALYMETAKLPRSTAENRIEMLTSEARGIYRIERKRDSGQISEAEAQKEIDQTLSDAQAVFQIKERRDAKEIPQEEAAAALAIYGIQLKVQNGSNTDAEGKAAVDQILSRHKDGRPRSDAEKQAIEHLWASSHQPPIEADRALVQRLLAEVAKEVPAKTTEKWGLLGLIGLNRTLGKIDDHFRSPFMPYGLSGIMLAAALVFFAYIGFDSISTHAEEARRPQRDVPIGILASLGICTVLYIAVSAIITGMEPYPGIDPNAAVAAAFRHVAERPGQESSTMLRFAAVLIAVGALAGLTSVLLITFLSQARIFLAMARDGLLPPGIFGAVHPRFRTPHRSTMLTGAVICVVGAFTPIAKLEEMVNIGTLMAFVIVCGAVLILRLKRPDAYRPFRCPAVYVLAPLGIVVNLLMMLFLPLDTWLRLVGWLVIGLCIYFTYGVRNSSLGRLIRKGLYVPGLDMPAVATAGMYADGAQESGVKAKED